MVEINSKSNPTKAVEVLTEAEKNAVMMAVNAYVKDALHTTEEAKEDEKMLGEVVDVIFKEECKKATRMMGKMEETRFAMDVKLNNYITERWGLIITEGKILVGDKLSKEQLDNRMEESLPVRNLLQYIRENGINIKWQSVVEAGLSELEEAKAEILRSELPEEDWNLTFDDLHLTKKCQQSIHKVFEKYAERAASAYTYNE